MKQRGFTLIELVVVIVILGILAATALPKFIDLTSEAETAAVNGVAGGISSAAAVNYAGFKGSNGTKGTAVTGANNGAVCTTAIVGGLLQSGWPTGYLISAGTTAMVANATAYCKVCKDSDSDATCDATEKNVDDVPVALTS